MKKIIDGKLYDTDTAKELCDLSPIGFSSSDFRWEDTRLYVTKKGAFFIAGEGNAMTRWAKTVGDTRSGGEGLQLIDEAEARDLIERHGSIELFTEVFGSAVEG